METSDIIRSDDGFLLARDFVKRDFCEPQIGTWNNFEVNKQTHASMTRNRGGRED